MLRYAIKNFFFANKWTVIYNGLESCKKIYFECTQYDTWKRMHLELWETKIKIANEFIQKSRHYTEDRKIYIQSHERDYAQAKLDFDLKMPIDNNVPLPPPPEKLDINNFKKMG